MLLGNSHIKHPGRELRLYLIKTGTRWHRRGNSDNFIIAGRRGYETVGEYRRIAWHVTR